MNTVYYFSAIKMGVRVSSLNISINKDCLAKSPVAMATYYVTLFSAFCSAIIAVLHSCLVDIELQYSFLKVLKLAALP